MSRVRLDSRWIPLGWLALTLGVTAALYARTLGPTLGGMFNSEEYQYAAYSMSLVHPTGYPLYLLLGKLFTTLVPFGDVAYRMNLFSAFWAWASVAVIFAIIYLLTRQAAPAALGGLIFASNEIVWRYASVAEVDTLTAFLAGLIFLTLLLWRGGKLPLEVVGLCYGLALAHHRTSLFYAPGVVLFVALAAGQGRRSLAIYARTILLILLPLLLYLYVPIRGAATGLPFANAGVLLNYVLGLSAGSGNLAPSAEWLGRLDLIYHQYLWNGLWGVGILIALVGLFFWKPNTWTRREVAGLKGLFGSILIIVSLFTIPYDEPDIERYLIVPMMILAISCGWGAVWLVEAIRRAGKGTAAARVGGGIALAALFLLPLWNIRTNLPKVDFSGNVRGAQFWQEAFGLPLARNAIVIGNWNELNSMLYMQRVEGERLDLQPVGVAKGVRDNRAALADALASHDAVYVTPAFSASLDGYHLDGLGPLVRVSDQVPQDVPKPAVTTNTEFGELVLSGFSLNVGLQEGELAPTVTVAPNQTVRVTLNWKVMQQPKADYLVRTRLVDANGQTLSETNEQPFKGRYPTSRWSKGETVTDVHGVMVPAGTPPGEYTMQLALTDTATKKMVFSPLTWKGVSVVRSPAPLTEQIFVQHPQRAAFGPLELLGYNGGGNTVKPGADLKFALAWLAPQTLTQDYSLHVQLSDDKGRVWQEATVPVVKTFPTSRWQAQDAFKEYYALALNGDAPEGAAFLRVILVDGAGRAVENGEALQLFSFQVAR